MEVGDTGSYILAFPLSESGLFQTGLNVGSAVVTLHGNRIINSPLKVKRIHYPNPVFVESSERILIIRTTKPTGGPQCEITDASYDELVGV